MPKRTRDDFEHDTEKDTEEAKVYQSMLKEEIENYMSRLFDEAKEERDFEFSEIHFELRKLNGFLSYLNLNPPLDCLKVVNRWFNDFKAKSKKPLVDMVEMLVHFEQYEDLVDFFILTEVIDFF
jgi:hypothetical protein